MDTTGAGDSFNAGFVYGFLTGKGLEECLACGNACGALNVTVYGGNTGFPDKEGLKEFMGKKERGGNKMKIAVIRGSRRQNRHFYQRPAGKIQGTSY